MGTKRQKLLKLKLTAGAALRRKLDAKARVGVVIRARVKGSTAPARSSAASSCTRR